MKKHHIVGTSSAGGYELPLYTVERPGDLDLAAPRRVRVVVVGGGLSGLACAADLASRGVGCTLLDEDDTVGVRGASSRGIAYARKSLETFDRLGALAPIAERGVTWSVGRTFDMERELFRIDLALQSRSVQPPFVNIQQFRVEAALVDCCYELGVDLRWKNAVTRVHAREDHALLDVQTPFGSYQLEAEWLIDATGVNSSIREDAGISVSGTRGEDKWCICDVRLAQDWPLERWTWVRAPFNGARAVWQHPLPDNVWRLDYQLDADADVQALGDDGARRLVRSHLGPGVEFEIVCTGPWSYRNQLADRFRQGRIVLIGDAAHAFSPFGGRGGNSGVQDAENIAWKLALVLRGLARASLIDSYDLERRAAAQLNLAVTSDTNRFLAPPSADEREARNQLLEAAVSDAALRPRINTGKLSEAFVYAPSDWVQSGGHAVSNMALVRGNGARVRLTELLAGPISGVLLHFCGDDAASGNLRSKVEALRCDARYIRVASEPGSADILETPELRLDIGLATGGDAAVWIRPDGHVATVQEGIGIVQGMQRALQGHAWGA